MPVPRLFPALTLLLLSGLALASPPGRSVVVAFGESLEPYVIPQLEAGIELDIIRAALKAQRYEMQPVFLSQKRLPQALADRRIDAVATIVPESGAKGAYSDVYISYEDKAITLSQRRLEINKIADLAGYSVSAFPLAGQYLGSEFAALTARHPDYHETGNQIDQNRLLYRGSVDVVVADYRIFNYMNKRMQADFNEQALPVTYHDIFIKLPYRVLFRQPTLRDAFNQGLKQIQQNGDYQRILKRYS
ncbi:polar amino acid transport system substrate-binding protein [Vogesella perlucida]|nr:polar amino acid transport system substrate-binding protein [Vogesella perlucida]